MAMIGTIRPIAMIDIMMIVMMLVLAPIVVVYVSQAAMASTRWVSLHLHRYWMGSTTGFRWATLIKTSRDCLISHC
ncbi:hypothetical protein [Aquamicrobium sp. LC103]|uniref:hypothetical protein n=1 Tax=Aquamicrobium sp. LC103 TaxID=1120658 RepID=UPI00109C4928|nr:hypothetical protein [Aquamicrobium sp. LC103]TKT75818.1 hypothetical protein XW59_018450 [Aquamicrobium sp. LC103]